VVLDVQWAAGHVIDDEVVDRDVQGLRDVGDCVEAWGDPAVLIAADLAGVASAGFLG
jgi:hypothetical protein